MSSLIQRITEPVTPITQGERDFAIIRNLPEPKRDLKYYYRHKLTDAEYSWIDGAFAPPGYHYPGFAVIVALDRHKNHEFGKRSIRVLEEFEPDTHNDIKGLIMGCIRLQNRYNTYPLMQQGFYSELNEASTEQVSSVIYDIHGDNPKFWPIPGPYSDYGNPWKHYFETLMQYVSPKSDPQLDPTKCPNLSGYMSMIKKGKISIAPEDNPAVAALAYAVTALMMKKPAQYEIEDSVFEVGDEY